jgi:hypothetical protein
MQGGEQGGTSGLAFPDSASLYAFGTFGHVVSGIRRTAFVRLIGDTHGSSSSESNRDPRYGESWAELPKGKQSEPLLLSNVGERSANVATRSGRYERSVRVDVFSAAISA